MADDSHSTTPSAEVPASKETDVNLPPEDRGSFPADEAGAAKPEGTEDSPESPPTEPDKRHHEKGKKKGKKDGKKGGKTGSARGIETMFRTSYRTHLDLSGLADNKANIMISINGIIISILLASIYPRIVDNRFILIPTAVLLVFCLLSMVYAVLAARPRVTRRTATLEDVRKGKANILFFGTFAAMDEEDFVEGMGDLIRNPAQAYQNMIRDIYGLGSVLETKYRLLRTSYTVFMIGLVLGVILFLGAFTWGSGAGRGL